MRKMGFGLVLVGLILNCRGKPELAEPQAPVKADAYDFALSDIEGNRHTLSMYRGRVVLLDFWATWCGPCKVAIPKLIELDKEYRAEGLVILGIGLDSESALKSFVQESGITYPVLIGDEPVAKAYEITAIPTVLLLNREGRVARRWVGFTPGMEVQFRAEIERLLAE